MKGFQGVHPPAPDRGRPGSGGFTFKNDPDIIYQHLNLTELRSKSVKEGRR